MTKISSYTKAISLYSNASIIYLKLYLYLKIEYSKDLDFPEELKKNYFYHSSYYNRTKQYMHANHFFGELLTSILGRKMSKEERRLFANLSSCAPIFDDFFENKTDLDHIRTLLHHPDKNSALSPSEKLSVHFLNNILKSDINQKAFLQAADDLFLAQLESKNQKDQSLNQEQLLDISDRKGGFSGLMYTLFLQESSAKDFSSLGYQLGSFGQLMDDVFDLYDDQKEGIRTYVNQSQKIIDLRFVLEEKEEQILGLAFKVSSSPRYFKKFKQVLAVFTSIIELAIEQYEKLELKQGVSPINCLSIERKAWIIDMEKASNMRKLFFKSVGKLEA
ncbi:MULTISPECIES: class 1 isoprenoid biosynthesis enzyme [unclassified Lentimicrobium]|uniref:class 1 isoprenoid biosynthesis enzyme n=1 Tax=unclassified Lentimicrobium TaxID=2677434 RepID=UPI0015519CFD|nr:MULTISPECIES: class 1 isoprenoid biosynthesis enzyme [unclassified Lentimicrobium]NPD46052.1 class 1 isoprenoid biosynthesis enzyme [Lentimicrobium sp. S6]NPD84956.1 class 1 isoprenoid biosynthesis enzyme [Lentimicrobium sp. L6]